jgi:RimJ/RimL family protein N-acetyltransferase
MDLNLNFTPFPVLNSGRLILRNLEPSDDPALFEQRSNKKAMEYLDRPMAQSIDDARALREKMTAGTLGNESITWAIALKEDPSAMIGTIGFWRIDPQNFRAELGYMMHPGFQRKGLMQEALEQVLHYGFHTMKLHSVEANINPANAASAGILERNHFVKEAHFRENYFFDGRFLDSVIYSLLSPIQ